MATTTNDERRAPFDEMVTAMNERALDRLDDLMSANFVRHCEPTPDVVIEDLLGYKAFLNVFTEGYPNNVQTIEHLAVDGDPIGVFAAYDGTHLGQFVPFAPPASESGSASPACSGGRRQPRRVLGHLGSDDHPP